MSIYWGVRPLKTMKFNTTDDICNGAIELATVKQYIEPGDVVVLTAGIPVPEHFTGAYNDKQYDENCDS